jgi:hypothetical protein
VALQSFLPVVYTGVFFYLFTMNMLCVGLVPRVFMMLLAFNIIMGISCLLVRSIEFLGPLHCFRRCVFSRGF